MKLVYTPEGASPIPQTGHPAPIAHFVLPNASTPHWLVSSDENLTLKVWDIRPEVALDAQGTAPEIAALTLDLGLQDIHTQFWCQHTPRKLWCEDSTGQLGYYSFSDNAQTVDFHLCKPLKSTTHGEHSQALALAQAQTVFFQLSANGGHWLENDVAEPTLSDHTAPTFDDWDLSLVTQTHLCAHENTFFLALRDAQSWQVFSFQALSSQAEPLTPRQPLERKVTDVEKNLMLSPQGDFLVVDRSLYALNEPTQAIGHYYGRALAFSRQYPRLLWASGDSLFITHLSAQNQGQITHHQSLHYNTPLAHWPVYWAVGAGVPSMEASSGDTILPEFWVSDQHRRNASGLLPSAQHDTFERVQQTAGQGGWVESLLFLNEDTLLLGGGARGTLCSLKLTPQAAQLSTRYESAAQPIEQLLLTPQIEQASQEPPQFLTLSGGTLNAHPETSFACPEKPWHKAFFNGALVQISTSATDAVVQLNHKGKTSLQRYNPAQTTWQELTAKLPEKAELIQSLGKRGQLFDSPNAAGPFKIFTDSHWRPLESELPFVDQALWQDQHDLLAMRCEQEIELWHITETFQYLGTLTSDDLFNAMVFSKTSAECWTLDNGGKFQHWRVSTQRDTVEAPQCLNTLQLHNWNEDYQDRVVAISGQGRYIAIGDSDLPLHIWDGQTGERCYACLVSLDHEGTEAVISCYSAE